LTVDFRLFTFPKYNFIYLSILERMYNISFKYYRSLLFGSMANHYQDQIIVFLNKILFIKYRRSTRSSSPRSYFEGDWPGGMDGGME